MMNFMTAIDDLVEQNRASVKAHGHRVLPTEPALQLAILTCMDSRIDIFGALGLKLGEAHMVRNAGGIASEDAIRSLLLSQWLLGTRSIMVIHHTRCGLETFDETMRATEDRDLWFRIARNYPVAYIDEVLACYRMSGTSMSSDPARMLKWQVAFINKHRSLGACSALAAREAMSRGARLP